VVFEFLKKKFQDLTSAAVPPGVDAPSVARGSYEERRSEAEALHDKGETARAVELLEGLAADLAGDGSFPLAVAVRHQISSWSSGPPVAQTAAEDGATMARQRKESGVLKVLPKGSVPAPLVPEGLRTSRFFADMTREEIAGFIASTGRRTFREGEVVLEQGEEGRSLFIVTRGVLGVETKGAAGGILRMGVLTMGDVFGEVAFLTGRPRTATVIAETGAECLEIAAEAWTGILSQYPRVQKVLEEVHRERARFAADAILEDLRRRREDKGV
jgi:hypothetical protein